MIEDSNKSGTYIEFSFEKSLRKYQKPPSKKTKSNQFINNQHSSSCQHCLEKLNRRDSIQSTDRKIKIQSSRKNELMRSRCRARQFSQTKRRKQQSNSANKSRQSSIKRQTQNNSCKQNQVSMILPDPLSEFNIGEELNLRHLKKEEILNLSLNKDVPRFECVDMSGIKKKIKEDQYQGQLSIEKIFNENNCKNCGDCGMQKENDGTNIKKRLELIEFISAENTSKIIEEQDESFSQLSLGQSNFVIYSQLIPSKENQIKEPHKEEIQHNEKQQIYHITENPVVSYAYFSSCTSVQSFQSSVYIDQMLSQGRMIQNQKQNHLTQQVEELNPFQNLRLQSKEELKKQYRNEQRQRVFYKIKRIGEIDKVCSQCQSISQEVKKELKIEMNNEELEQQQKIQKIQIPQNEYSRKVGQVSVIYEPIKPQCESTNEMEYECSNHLENKQEENPFKRATPCEVQKNVLKEIYKKKNRKINFEIHQDYERLGRVRIPGLGRENQSICLSVRRLSKQSQSLSKDFDAISSLDENKVINYLISQRPYLQKNKTQLEKLLSLIMGQNNHRVELKN